MEWSDVAEFDCRKQIDCISKERVWNGSRMYFVG